jgi:hypothetical protein
MVAASFEPQSTISGGTTFALDLSRLWVGVIIFATLLILGFGLRIGRATSEQRTLAISNVASGD